MKVITAHTKISALISAHPDVIDAIASINPHFKKLKNPVLRKVLAARVTIADAAKIGKCTIEEFFDKLKPLGFVTDDGTEEPEEIKQQEAPLTRPFDVQLDVRADIENERDPFRKIMEQISALNKGQVLLLINSFEPIPLIRILNNRNYKTEVVYVNDNEVYTYISKGTEGEMADTAESPSASFEEITERYEGRMKIIDVRHLPMPQPMTTILNELQALPSGMALFVHHKKMPVFLLPELKERKFELVFKPAEDGVKLIIYKPAQA